MFRKSQGRINQQGILLVESMVALALFSIAILGLSALQITSSKNNLSALLKTETAVASSEIIDLMRTNRTGVALDQYDFALGDGVFDTETNQAETDVNSWLINLNNVVAAGMTPDASIACAGPFNLDCTILIQWNDDRAEQDELNTELFIYTTNVNL